MAFGTPLHGLTLVLPPRGAARTYLDVDHPSITFVPDPVTLPILSRPGRGSSPRPQPPSCNPHCTCGPPVVGNAQTWWLSPQPPCRVPVRLRPCYFLYQDELHPPL